MPNLRWKFLWWLLLLAFFSPLTCPFPNPPFSLLLPLHTPKHWVLSSQCLSWTTWIDCRGIMLNFIKKPVLKVCTFSCTSLWVYLMPLNYTLPKEWSRWHILCFPYFTTIKIIKCYILYASIYIFLKWQMYSYGEKISSCQELGKRRKGGGDCGYERVALGILVMVLFFILILVVATQISQISQYKMS